MPLYLSLFFLQCPHLYICIVCMYICLNCIYLYLYVYCQCLMLTVCTKGLRVMQFKFSVCMYCTCGRIDNKADLTWLDLFCWTQRKIFWRMWETEQFWGTIDFHSICFFLLWKSMVLQNSLVTNFLQNIFLCVRQNKQIHTGLELLEGE